MNRKTILLVEDNRDDETLALWALRKSKVTNEITVVRDGREALDYFFASGKHSSRDVAEQPAVVLLDLKLPKIDGLEVLRQLRADERTKLIHVVIFTSSREEKDVLKGYELGANSYICKPVNAEEFHTAVHHIASYWLKWNEAIPR